MSKFDRGMFATTGFLKQGGVGPVLFGYMEVVILGPAEVFILIKILDMILAMYVCRVFIKR